MTTQPFIIRLLKSTQFKQFFPTATLLLASTPETYWIAGIGFVIWIGAVVIDNNF